MTEGKLPKICMVLPYFGKLPSYWSGALSSFADNYEIDFLIITDCEVTNSAPNIKIVKMDWKVLQQHVKKSLSSVGYKKICITHPYKLCDYKPTYGFLFQDYLMDYDYWGFIDCDLYLGNVVKFLQKVEFEKYDRVGAFGHFSLIKNKSEFNLLFTENIKNDKSFNEVVRTTFPCHFDESSFNEIFKVKGLSFYETRLDATMGIFSYEFKWLNQTFPELGELFVVEKDGTTVVYSQNNDGTLKRSEVMYFHYLNKKNIEIPHNITKPFCITRKGVFEIEMSKIQAYLETTKCTVEEQNTYQKHLEKENKIKSRERLLREIKYNKLNSFYFIFHRFFTFLYHKRLAKDYKKAVNKTENV